MQVRSVKLIFTVDLIQPLIPTIEKCTSALHKVTFVLPNSERNIQWEKRHVIYAHFPSRRPSRDFECASISVTSISTIDILLTLIKAVENCSVDPVSHIGRSTYLMHMFSFSAPSISDRELLNRWPKVKMRAGGNWKAVFRLFITKTPYSHFPMFSFLPLSFCTIDLWRKRSELSNLVDRESWKFNLLYPKILCFCFSHFAPFRTVDLRGISMNRRYCRSWKARLQLFTTKPFGTLAFRSPPFCSFSSRWSLAEAL